MNRYKTRSKNNVPLIVGMRPVQGFRFVIYAETLSGAQVYVTEPCGPDADPDDVMTLAMDHVSRVDVEFE